jgi:Asp-tRNA(Asn)/Glu-tRNA(Gln) amidotransferase A subunit family amidase
MSTSEPPLPPRFAFVRSPVWEHADETTCTAFAELVATLGEAVSEVELGERFARGIDHHRTIMEVEMAHNLHRDYEQGGERLSSVLRQLIERGRARPAVEYMAAVAGIAPMNQMLDPVFDEYDAILTPAAPGEAPRGHDSTGNPIFCTLWTYLGTPAVTLPLLRSPAGLPLGVQLVARRGNDARLLRTANWLAKKLGGRTALAGRVAPSRQRSGKGKS